MDIFEKINRTFGGWYEGLFGQSDDVRPRDILRKILAALEENRKEGFDNKVYVPNQYILEISVDDPEEKEYLLSFLDRDELEAAIRQYCTQNRYHIRGGLDFTINEVAPDEAVRREKVRVKVRYNSKIEPKQETPSIPADPAPVVTYSVPQPPEDATVARLVNYEEEGTVPAVGGVMLQITEPDQPVRQTLLAGTTFTVGRSSLAGNDLVLAGDGLVSRRHARIEKERNGSYTIYDLSTTNGTTVNGKAIDNCLLTEGDNIGIGNTVIKFGSASPTILIKTEPAASRGPRLVVTDGPNDGESFLIGEVAIVGRGVTNDIVLGDRSVATRHLLIQRTNGFQVQALDAEYLTLVNGNSLDIGVGSSVVLKHGDVITAGTLKLRFEESVQ